MANRKISEFTALTAPASGDTFAILDVDASGAEVNKKITFANVLGKAPDGSAASPAFSFNSDTNSGISGGSDTLVLSTGGTAAISVDSSQNVTLSANLTVSGTTTTIDTTTLTVKDKNIEIAKGNGNDAAVDGAGITIDSTEGDKTWNWVDSTDAWTSSENIDLASGKVLKVAGTQVLSATNFTGTSAVATAVTVADESSDTSCNVLFTTAATGNLAPKSGTNLTFNSDTGALTATSFVGALTGNASGSSGSCTGNAATSTEATNVTVSANNSTDETVYPVFVDGATGTQGAETDTGLTYNPSSGLLTSTSFAGALTGNVTGNASGSSGSCTGNAATSTALATSRNFSLTGEITASDTGFNGSADCDIATTIADNVVDEANLKVSNSPTNGYYLSAQSGDTGGLTWAAVSQYTTPLTTQGDILYRDGSGDQRLGAGTSGYFLKTQGSGADPVWAAVPAGVGGASGVDFNDNVKARWGTGNDLEVFHDSNNSYINHTGTGDLYVQTNTSGDKLQLWSNDDIYLKPQAGENGINIIGNGAVEIYYDNTKRIETSTTGATVTGVATVSNGIVETAITIATNHTITTNYNAMSAGPVTVSATVTVPSGSVWTVI